MKKGFLLLVGALLFISCGDNVRDAKDTTDQDLVSVWDSISNTPNKCYERLVLNSDKTFWWYSGGVMNGGTWGISEATLNFMYTGKAWEVVKFNVDKRELGLVKVGVYKTYVKVPSQGYVSACPK